MQMIFRVGSLPNSQATSATEEQIVFSDRGGTSITCRRVRFKPISVSA